MKKTDTRLTAKQKKDRENMILKLKNSFNEDIRIIVKKYNTATDIVKEEMRIIYEKQGGMYVNAIFNGDIELAKTTAPGQDKKLF